MALVAQIAATIHSRRSSRIAMLQVFVRIMFIRFKLTGRRGGLEWAVSAFLRRARITARARLQQSMNSGCR
jgi:hypothetical protein